MKFPGIALLDIRIGHKERHPVHSEPISFMLCWPPYLSFSVRLGSKQFWFYLGWEPEFDHFDFTWWALKITKGHMDTGRDDNNP